MSAGRDKKAKTRQRKEQRFKAYARKDERLKQVKVIRKSKRQKRSALRAKNRGDIEKYNTWLGRQSPDCRKQNHVANRNTCAG